MKLYHGTSQEAFKRIMVEGIQPSLGIICEGVDCDKMNRELGYIYLTESLRVASKWGGVVIEIDSETLDKQFLSTYKEPICEMLGIPFFWNYKKAIPPELFKSIEHIDYK
jgi:hypothetical protein